MIWENAIWSHIPSILSKHKLTHLVDTVKLQGLAAENEDFREYLGYLKHLNKEATTFMSHLTAIPCYYLCELAKRGINIDVEVVNFMMEVIQLKGIARVKAIDTIYRCLIFGGVQNRKLIMNGPLVKCLLNLAVGDESEMLCNDCELPGVIYVLLQDDKYKSALLELGATKVLIKLLHHQCECPARYYALRSIEDLSYHPEYHLKLVTEGVLQAICDLYPFKICDSDSELHIAVSLWNMVKAGNKSNEIFTEVVSSLCQFVEHREASLAMSDVVDHMHLDAILHNLDEDKFTSSMKKLLNKVLLEAETREKKCLNNVNLEDFEQDGATEFAQKGEKDVLVRMELKLRYLEDQL
jgi:hypothetical protein